MKFVVDAQLPCQLAIKLSRAGHDAIHTSSFPQGNRNSDEEIISLAAKEARIVITKDSDFVNSFLLRRMPPKLLLISTGNISNHALWTLIEANLKSMEITFAEHDYVELSTSAITVHM